MKRRFENMKIGRKLIYAFAIIIFLYIITVIISIGNIESMSKRTKQMYNESFANVQSSLAMIAGLQSVGKNITLVLTTDGVVDEQEYLKNIETGIAQSSQELDQLSTGYVSDEDKVAELSREYAALTAVRTNMLEKLKAGLKDQALDIYVNQYSVQFNKVKTLLEQVVDLCVADAAEQLAEGQSMNFKVVVLIISLAVVIILFTIVLCVATTTSIVHPVDEVKRAANAIANGQLKTELTYTSENELGQLADDIRSTAEALNQYVSEVEKGLTALGEGKLNYKPEVVFKGDFIALGNAMEKITGLLRDSLQQIGSSAELVSGGAEQVSNGAQALARGAAEQASSVEELAVSINEIADSVRDNADNAVQSSRLADNVGKSLTESDEQMQGLMEAVEHVKKNSREINKIVKEIEDIAFQTNILALNAAVEAARAGEAGKGFSVVAGAIRRLASQTTAASKLTAELIEKNAKAVDTGMTAAASTAETMKESVDGARQVNSMVDKISGVCVQQADAIAQVRKSIELISEIVQGNSATSEESAAASEELSAQALVLKEMVEQFEL